MAGGCAPPRVAGWARTAPQSLATYGRIDSPARIISSGLYQLLRTSALRPGFVILQ